MVAQFNFITSLGTEALEYGWADSPWGKLFLVFKNDTLYGLGMAESDLDKPLVAYFEKRLKTQLHHQNNLKAQEISGKLGKEPITCKVIGTPFQHKIWKALIEIPKGQTRFYSEIAQNAGHPQAVRATGSAIGQNPISILIPCHRALPKSGGLGNFLWGSSFKKKLLLSENNNSAQIIKL